jgi:2-polyprenyl-3-methyl-5-hydroxy-6-metoxy-1,4-benzoquinol methylase
MGLLNLLDPVGRWLKETDFVPPRFGFRMFRMAYRLFPQLGCKGDEWKFVLDRLPKLGTKGIKVADIGGGLSLFPFELAKRGYDVTVYDQLPLKRKTRNKFKFIQSDVRDIKEKDYDMVLCISVIEHIGCGAYGDEVFRGGDTATLSKICEMLKTGGLTIITTPHLNYNIEGDRKYTFRDMIGKIEAARMKVLTCDYLSHQIILIAEKL